MSLSILLFPLGLLAYLLYTYWLIRWQPVWLPLPAASLLALGLVTGSVLANHLAAPLGIVLTPGVLVSVAALLNAPRQPTRVVAGAAATAGLACLHDAGLKLYGGGQHDAEGQGFIHLFLLAGLLPTYLLLVVFLLRSPAASWPRRLGAAVLLPLLVGVYLYFCGWLGLGRFYETHLVY